MEKWLAFEVEHWSKDPYLDIELERTRKGKERNEKEKEKENKIPSSSIPVCFSSLSIWTIGKNWRSLWEASKHQTRKHMFCIIKVIYPAYSIP